jgi:hypothetical protein
MFGKKTRSPLQALGMFVGQSLYYSVFVSLRMLPILAVTLYTAMLLFQIARSEPLVVILVVALLYVPTIMFLYLNAIRCGLTAMGETEPPIAKHYLPATVRLIRFNLMVTNLLIAVVGVGGMALLAIYTTPHVWQAFRESLAISSVEDVNTFLDVTGQLPLGTILFFALAFTLGAALTGTTAGATAHSVAMGAPKYDMIWGATRQWYPLLLLGSVVIILPTVALVLYFGGPMAELWELSRLSPQGVVVVSLYYLWAMCALCAGQGLAFVRTSAENEDRRREEFSDMSGPILADEDVRAIRLERMENAKIAPKTTSDIGDKAVND